MRLRVGCEAGTGIGAEWWGEPEVRMRRRLGMGRECVWRENEGVSIGRKR